MCLVAYFRAETETGVQLFSVNGKCRIAQMKRCTFPKLELQAALHAFRLKQLVIGGLNFNKTKAFYWTDTLTLLQWILSAHLKQQVFLGNWIGETIDCWNVDEWSQVKGRINPAYIGTRGMTVSQLNNSEWLIGLAWFRRKQEMWSEHIRLDEEPDVEKTICLTQAEQSVTDWSKISSYRKLNTFFHFVYNLEQVKRDQLVFRRWTSYSFYFSARFNNFGKTFDVYGRRPGEPSEWFVWDDRS